jgi:hypothetical protein
MHSLVKVKVLGSMGELISRHLQDIDMLAHESSSFGFVIETLGLKIVSKVHTKAVLVLHCTAP